MGKGGGKSTSFSTSMAPWTKNQHLKLLNRGEDMFQDRSGAAGYEKYGQYDGDRIVGFSPDQETSFQAQRDMFNAGDPYSDYAMNRMEAGTDFANQMGDVNSSYNPYSFSTKDIQSTYGGPRTFDFGQFGMDEAMQYMNPYQQMVIDQELAAGRDAYQQELKQTDAARTAAGSRGAYRSMLDDALRSGEYQGSQADIQMAGSQRGFEQARQSFEADRSAAIKAATMGQADRETSARMQYDAEVGNRAESLKAAGMTEQSALAAAKMQMEAEVGNRNAILERAKFASGQAELADKLGGSAQQREMERISALERVGTLDQGQEQQRAQLAYEDFLRQSNWDKNEMDWFQRLISGAPAAETEYSLHPGASLGSQAAGLGMLASSAPQLMGKMKS